MQNGTLHSGSASRLRHVKLASRALWNHLDFDEERDRRVGNVDELDAAKPAGTPRSRHPRRCSPSSGPSSTRSRPGRDETATVSGKWSTPKRCNCKDANGKELGRTCPKLSGRHHGTVGYTTRIPTTSGVRELRRFGFATKSEADKAARPCVGPDQTRRSRHGNPAAHRRSHLPGYGPRRPAPRRRGRASPPWPAPRTGRQRDVRRGMGRLAGRQPQGARQLRQHP